MRKGLQGSPVWFLACLGFLSLVRCSSTPPEMQRVWLDSSTHKDNPPDWVEETRLSWDNKDKIIFKSQHSVRGDERVNGCFDLAKLDVKETVLSELANDIKGSIDNAQQSINENAEVVLGKVRSGEFKGRLTGLRHTDQYFERYRVGGEERIECYVLSQMTKDDHDRVKKNVLFQMQEVDAKLKDAIKQKQIDFFKTTQSAPAGSGEGRTPASEDTGAH